MKNSHKIILGVIVALSIVGAYFFPKSVSKTVIQAGAVGDTNSTRRIAQTVLDLSTTTATTVNGACTLYNGDSRDRIITSVDYYLASLTSFGNNGGVASTTWKLATSTDIYNAPAGSYVLNTTIATSTANGAIGNQLYIASSTPGSTATFPYRVWTAGSCLNLLQNSTSTATGVITVGYIVSQ
jgi:hypothetical protein